MVSKSRLPHVYRIPQNAFEIVLGTPPAHFARDGFVIRLVRAYPLAGIVAVYPQTRSAPLTFAIDSDLTDRLGTYRMELMFADRVVWEGLVEVVQQEGEFAATVNLGEFFNSVPRFHSKQRTPVEHHREWCGDTPC